MWLLPFHNHITPCLLFSTWCLCCDCNVLMAHNSSSVVQVGFEEHIASINARVWKAALSLPPKQQTLGREGGSVPNWVHVEFPEQARNKEGLLRPLNTYIMSNRDCKGSLWGCLWFVAGWAWLVVFIFASISRSWLYFLSVYNSVVWILIRPLAQACYMSERCEDCQLHSPWDDAKRTRLTCHWSIDLW